MRFRASFLGGIVAAVASAGLAFAAPVDVPNGGFENGSFPPWQKFEPGAGQWELMSVNPRGIIPLPTEGETHTVLSQSGAGLNVLHRTLRLRKNKVNRISLDLFYDNSLVGQFSTPRHFRFRGAQDNQQVRIDVMKP